MVFIKKFIVFVAVFVIMTLFALPCFAWTAYSNTGLPAYPADFSNYTYKLIVHNTYRDSDPALDLGYIMFLSNSPILVSVKNDPYVCFLYNGVKPHAGNGFSGAGVESGIYAYTSKSSVNISSSMYTQFSFTGKIFIYNDTAHSFGLTDWTIYSGVNAWYSGITNFGVTGGNPLSTYGSYYSNNIITLAGQSEPFFTVEVVPPVIPAVTGVPLIVSQHGGQISQAVSQNSLILLGTGCLILAVLLGVSLIPRVISLFR